MRTYLKIVLGAAGCLLVLALEAPAGSHGIAIGTRYHVDHSSFEALPFGNGDTSYGLSYEYHDETAYWQVAADYMPDVTGVDGVDYTITPQVNLILKDRLWRAGLGALSTYARQEDGSDDWTDIYWQVILGAGLPVFGLNLEVQAYYTMDSWGDIGDFDFDDVELGAWLTFPF